MRLRSGICDRARADPRSAPAGRSPPAGATRRIVEHLDLAPVDDLHALDDELRDAVAAIDVERGVRIEVHEEDADLVPVARVDESRRVQAGHAVTERETRPG